MNKKDKLSKLFHDAKSPLTHLSGYLQLLEEDLKETGSHIDYLSDLINSCDELNTSLNHLKDEITKLLD